MKILGAEMDWQDVFQGVGLVVMTSCSAMSAMVLIIPRISQMNTEQLEEISLAVRTLPIAAFLGGVCAIIGTILVTRKDERRNAEIRKEELEEDRRFRKLFKEKDYKGLDQFWEEKIKKLQKD